MFLLQIKADEVKKVLLLWSITALLAMGFAMGWSAVTTLIVKRAGVVYLPYAYTIINILGIFFSLTYMSYANRIPQGRFLLYATSVSGAVLLLAVVILHLSLSHDDKGLSPALVLFFILAFGANGAINTTLSVQVYNLADALFHPSQATRLFPILATALPIGGVLGGLSINLIIAHIGVINLVTAWAVCCLVAAMLIRKLSNTYGAYLTSRRRRSVKDQAPLVLAWQGVKEGVTRLRYPLVRTLLFVTIFYAAGYYVFQDYLHSCVMNATFGSEETLNRYYGYYAIAINVSLVLAQICLASRLLKKIGISNGLFFLPGALFISFAFLFFYPSFLPALLMHYFADFSYSVMDSNSKQLAYHGITSDYRSRVRAFQGGIAKPIGVVVASGAIILINNLIPNLWLPSEYIVVLTGLVCVAIWLLFVGRVRHYYLRALVDNSKADNRRDALDAIESLGESRHSQAIKQLVYLLTKDPDKEIKLASLKAIGHTNSLSAIRYVTALLESPDEDFRAAAVRALVKLERARMQPFLKFNLRSQMEEMLKNDPSAAVRSEALAYIMSVHPDRNLPKFVAEMLRCGDPAIRERTISTLAATGLPYLDYSIDRFLRDPDPMVQAAAIKALHHFPERLEELLPILQRLIASPDKESRLAGLKALVEVPELAPTDSLVSLFQDQELEIRVFAALNYLNRSSGGGDLAKEALDVIVQALSSPNEQDFLATELVPLLPDLPEEVLDMLLIQLASLPPERQNALPALGRFHQALEKMDMGKTMS